jgi:long-chain acyl-CoA synthetase
VSDNLRLFAGAVNANLAGILSEPGNPDAPALIHEGTNVSYAELGARVETAAAILAGHGVGPGDRVAIVLPNAPSFVEAYFGALRLGAIVVPVNVLLRPAEIEERLGAVSATAVVFDADRAALVTATAERLGVTQIAFDAHAPAEGDARLVEREADDPAVILFTSGTSAVSKGAVLTHGSIGAAARNAAEALAFGPKDVVLGAAPFSHVLGQSTGLIATLATGGAVAVVPRFDPVETLGLMVATGTTVLLGVPTMCIALCDAARTAPALPPLRLAHVGGAPVPVEVTREFEETFGADVYEGYGLTEISGIATTYRKGEPRKPGSVGRPLGDTELQVVSFDGALVPPGEVGEIRFRGSSVIPGYWGGADVSADGWLATGDLGRVDDEGYLFIVDRLKDMIIRNGYNVYPREVEEVLYEHPDVLEAAVIGIPDPRLGDEVVALVKLRPGTVCVAAEIQQWVRERIAAYKYPRHIVVVDSLPTGPTGKILKREIDREQLARDLA